MRLFDDAGGGGNGWAGEPLIVDSFAGGGGASTGIEMALGRSPDIAINHNADALAMHEVNHPETLHLSKNIWQVDPLEAVGNRPVGLAWFSPDCKHFSKAKGGRPVKRSIRDLAWVVVLWARRVRPQVIMLENVEEFRDWGPVSADGKPCAERKGQTFAQWTGELRRLGYRLEFRELRGFNYGAPTIRKRFFMIARRDGRPIVWPKATHGRPDDPDVIAGRKKPWRTAAEIIDWSLPCPSIFETSAEIFEKHGVRAVRPLADATMRRIARGVVRYVLEAKKPFVVTFAQQGGGNRSPDDPLHTVTASPKDQNAIVVPSFVGCGGRAGESAPRGGDEPSRDAQARERRGGTQTAKADGCVVAAHLTKFQTGSTGSQLDEPAPTVTANSYVKRPGGAAPIGIVAASMQAISPRVGEMSDRTGGRPGRISRGTPLCRLRRHLPHRGGDYRRRDRAHPGRDGAWRSLSFRRDALGNRHQANRRTDGHWDDIGQPRNRRALSRAALWRAARGEERSDGERNQRAGAAHAAGGSAGAGRGAGRQRRLARGGAPDVLLRRGRGRHRSGPRAGRAAADRHGGRKPPWRCGGLPCPAQQ